MRIRVWDAAGLASQTTLAVQISVSRWWVKTLNRALPLRGAWFQKEQSPKPGTQKPKARGQAAEIPQGELEALRARASVFRRGLPKKRRTSTLRNVRV